MCAEQWPQPSSKPAKTPDTTPVNPEFQPDIREILARLDALNVLLDPKNFKGNSVPPDAELNANITGITAFKNVLEQLSRAEYRVLLAKVREVEDKMYAASEKCAADRKNGNNSSKYIAIWLDKEGPAVMASLKKLLEKVQK